MEFIYFEKICECDYTRTIVEFLTLADKEFIPPLSCRDSSTQADLSGAQSASDGILSYYRTMASQPAILAVENSRCMGFMAFKIDYTCRQISAEQLPNLYASTCVVHPDARGKGLMTGFYREMIRLFPERKLFTRTWHTNLSHLHVLDKLGFREWDRLPNHRGPGMDTVYFRRSADK